MQRYRGPWRVIFIGIYASTARFYAGVSLKLPLGEAGQNGGWKVDLHVGGIYRCLSLVSFRQAFHRRPEGIVDVL